MVLATNGPRRVPHAAHKNVSDSERAVSAAVGGLFVASGMKKRGVGGLALALIGAELLRRGEAAAAHVEACDACRDRLRAMVSVRTLLARRPLPEPPAAYPLRSNIEPHAAHP